MSLAVTVVIVRAPLVSVAPAAGIHESEPTARFTTRAAEKSEE